MPHEIKPILRCDINVHCLRNVTTAHKPALVHQDSKKRVVGVLAILRVPRSTETREAKERACKYCKCGR